MEHKYEKTHPQVNPHFLRYLREKLQLTHEAIAEEVGVEVELVLHWETGKRQPNQKHLIVLERMFGIKPGTLVLEIRQLIIQDFNAAYFGDEDARSRLNWADEKRKLAQSLDIIPPLPKKRIP